jgi:tellurite methyltransferase
MLQPCICAITTLHTSNLHARRARGHRPRRAENRDTSDMERAHPSVADAKKHGRNGCYACGMQTAITGFHRDEAGEWVAELACGHTQHMRHRPPWQNRAWVSSDSERLQRVGAAIDCSLCDMPVLPVEVEEYKRTPTFTAETVPSGLLSDHRTRAGVWARIVVSSGELEYSFGEPRRVFVLSAKRVGIVIPEVPHQVSLRGPVSFHVEFLRAPPAHVLRQPSS